MSFKMKMLFVSVLLIVIHKSRGDFNINVQPSVTNKNLSYNSFFETNDLNPYIFDAYDPQMTGTYKSLLKIYHNHLMNGTRRSPKGIDSSFEAALFWKTLKLAAAYLKYEHYRGRNSSLNSTCGNNTSEPTSQDGDTLLNEMYQYYTRLAAERSKSRNGSNFIPIYPASRKSLVDEIKSVFNASANYVRQWWMQTKLFCLKIGKSIRRVKRIGATFVHFLSHLTKRLLMSPVRRANSSSHSLLDYEANITEAILNQGDGPEILFQKMS